MNETAEEEVMDQTGKARRHKCGVVADGDEETGHVLLEELSVKRGSETMKKTNR